MKSPSPPETQTSVFVAWRFQPGGNFAFWMCLGSFSGTEFASVIPASRMKTAIQGGSKRSVELSPFGISFYESLLDFHIWEFCLLKRRAIQVLDWRKLK